VKLSAVLGRQLSARPFRFSVKAIYLAGFRVPAGKPASQSADHQMSGTGPCNIILLGQVVDSVVLLPSHSGCTQAAILGAGK